MYGKRRIVITKKKQIILAGGGSYIQIGKFGTRDGGFTGQVLHPENYIESKFTDENSMNFNFLTLKDLRKFITAIYKEKLTQ